MRRRWPAADEWRAVVAIVTPESHFDPCARWPGRHDCGYTGSSSCGIPQANPCPREWRGRLASTWRAQVHWLIAYIARRYRSPVRALRFRELHGSY